MNHLENIKEFHKGQFRKGSVPTMCPKCSGTGNTNKLNENGCTRCKSSGILNEPLPYWTHPKAVSDIAERLSTKYVYIV